MTPGCTSAPKMIEGLGWVTPRPHRKRPLFDVFVDCEPCGLRTVRWMQSSQNPHVRETGAHVAWQQSKMRDMSEFRPYWEAYGYGETNDNPAT